MGGNLIDKTHMLNETEVSWIQKLDDMADSYILQPNSNSISLEMYQSCA